MNWQRFAALLASRTVHRLFESLTRNEDKKHINILILDDSVYGQPYAKNAE